MYVANSKELSGNKRFHGFVPDVMNRLTDMLSFDYELYLIPDGQFGAKMENGEWNGMIGEILAGVSQFSNVTPAMRACKVYKCIYCQF